MSVRGDFYLASKVMEIDGRASIFPKLVPTLFDFGMSWSHLSAFDHTFSGNVTALSVWTSIFSNLDQQCPLVSVLACHRHTFQRLEQFCESEPGQHDTYI